MQLLENNLQIYKLTYLMSFMTSMIIKIPLKVIFV